MSNTCMPTPIAYIPELDFEKLEHEEDGCIDTELYAEDDQSIIRNFELAPVYCEDDVLRLSAINAALYEALGLIAGEHREDAATWMRGVARAAIAKAKGGKV